MGVFISRAISSSAARAALDRGTCVDATFAFPDARVQSRLHRRLRHRPNEGDATAIIADEEALRHGPCGRTLQLAGRVLRQGLDIGRSSGAPERTAPR
ncbi:MAG: hypothetical protein QM811_09270 [Pirellulales bacterium]